VSRKSGLALVALAFCLANFGVSDASAAGKPCLMSSCAEDSRPPVARTSGDCPTLATLVCAGGDLIGGAVDAVGDLALAPVKAAGDAVMNGLTNWVAGGAAWLLNKAARLLERSSRPALGSTWFRSQYTTALQIALALSLVFLLCAVLQATLRHDTASLARATFVALPLSVLLCFAAVTLVETALGVTDWMTASVLQNFEKDTGEFFSDVGEVLVPASLTGNPLPGFLLFLGALVTALATFVVWLELVMREAAIYVAVAFLPLCFSGMVWQRTAHWSRRLVEFLAGVILAKFAIATAVALAARPCRGRRRDADRGAHAVAVASRHSDHGVGRPPRTAPLVGQWRGWEHSRRRYRLDGGPSGDPHRRRLRWVRVGALRCASRARRRAFGLRGRWCACRRGRQSAEGNQWSLPSGARRWQVTSPTRAGTRSVRSSAAASLVVCGSGKCCCSAARV
jgi:hypothetical protein